VRHLGSVLMNSMMTMINLPFDGATELRRVSSGAEERYRSNNGVEPTPFHGAAQPECWASICRQYR
jgi:hypothetical protein